MVIKSSWPICRSSTWAFSLSNDRVEKEVGSKSFVGEAYGSLMELGNCFTSLPGFVVSRVLRVRLKAWKRCTWIIWTGLWTDRPFMSIVSLSLFDFESEELMYGMLV